MDVQGLLKQTVNPYHSCLYSRTSNALDLRNVTWINVAHEGLSVVELMDWDNSRFRHRTEIYQPAKFANKYGSIVHMHRAFYSDRQCFVC